MRDSIPLDSLESLLEEAIREEGTID